MGSVAAAASVSDSCSRTSACGGREKVADAALETDEGLVARGCGVAVDWFFLVADADTTMCKVSGHAAEDECAVGAEGAWVSYTLMT